MSTKTALPSHTAILSEQYSRGTRRFNTAIRWRTLMGYSDFSQQQEMKTKALPPKTQISTQMLHLLHPEKGKMGTEGRGGIFLLCLPFLQWKELCWVWKRSPIKLQTRRQIVARTLLTFPSSCYLAVWIFLANLCLDNIYKGIHEAVTFPQFSAGFTSLRAHISTEEKNIKRMETPASNDI